MAKRTQSYAYGVPKKYTDHRSSESGKKESAAEIKRTSDAYEAGEDIDIKAVQAARTKRGRKSQTA